MADIVFNIAKGKVNEYVARVDGNDPAASALIVVLLKTVEADATLRDYDTLSALLAAGGGTANVEANFTNYARKTLTDTNVTAPAPDDTNDRQDASLGGSLVYAAAGGATNNSLVKLLVCYDADTAAGTDANIVPLTAHDITVTTDGTDLTISEASSAFYRAS